MDMNIGTVVALIKAMGGGADPAVIEEKVADYLDAHPELVTTVQDGSITEAKLATTVAQKLGLISSLSGEIDDIGSDVTDLKSAISDSGNNIIRTEDLKNVITTDITDITGNKIIYFSSGWINTSLETVDINTVNSGDFVYAIVSCVEGDKFTISGTGAAAARLWAFVASDGTQLTVAGARETRTNYVITAPQNSAYLVVNARTTSEKIGCFRGVSFYNQYLEDQANFANTEYLSALIPSSYDRMIVIDTVNKTITIPSDTLVPTLVAHNYYYYLQIGGTIEYGNLGTGAFKVYYDISSGEFVLKTFRQKHPDNSVLIMTVRNSPFQIYATMDYVVDGKYRAFDYYNSPYVLSYKNDNIRVINHRGYNTVAPENTMPAFKLSRENKFMYIETDVQFSAPDTDNPNGVAVLIHDATIDRTSNGTGNVADLTYEQLLQYDFGSWKSSKYAGTKIPTLDEFLLFCKNTGVHAYLELKAGNSTQIGMIVNSVKKHGMRKNVTYISQDASYLSTVKTADPSARLGYITSEVSASVINTILGLKTAENEVMCDLYYIGVTDSAIDTLAENDIPLELWTINSTTQITSTYATGYTTDSVKLWSRLYNSEMT